MDSPPFSVLISTYTNDDPDYLSVALESVIKQTAPPAEIVLVKDGPLSPALDSVVQTYHENYPELFEIRKLSENRGPGVARRIGVEITEHETIAMMDADDISVPTRFERQLEHLRQHPETDAVGGYIAEFSSNPDDPYAIRKVPLKPEAIASKARFRSPMNQTTVMARKQALLDAGNYRSTTRMEDYDLWARMLSGGATLTNVPEVLVNVRAGDEMYERRGGLEYARAEIRLQREFIRMGFVSVPVALLNLAVRLPGRLAPDQLRGWAYSRFFRRDS
ncbi:glycosyltransferase [Halobium palmae]|uniref:Glycosyltransferase n=1 Tax=Halobium palmae TaxID=1776492 RepID=A0ABD5RX50_9EURY